jgi:hypothetical protein
MQKFCSFVRRVSRVRKSDAIGDRFELLGRSLRVLIPARRQVSIQIAVREQA